MVWPTPGLPTHQKHGNLLQLTPCSNNALWESPTVQSPRSLHSFARSQSRFSTLQSGLFHAGMSFWTTCFVFCKNFQMAVIVLPHVFELPLWMTAGRLLSACAWLLELHGLVHASSTLFPVQDERRMRACSQHGTLSLSESTMSRTRPHQQHARSQSGARCRVPRSCSGNFRDIILTLSTTVSFMLGSRKRGILRHCCSLFALARLGMLMLVLAANAAPCSGRLVALAVQCLLVDCASQNMAQIGRDGPSSKTDELVTPTCSLDPLEADSLNQTCSCLVVTKCRAVTNQ
jgi:hypothetical protein